MMNSVSPPYKTVQSRSCFVTWIQSSFLISLSKEPLLIQPIAFAGYWVQLAMTTRLTGIPCNTYVFLKWMIQLFPPHIPCFKTASKNGNSRRARSVCVQRSHSSMWGMSNVLAEWVNMYPHSLHSGMQASKQENLKWFLYLLGLHF